MSLYRPQSFLARFRLPRFTRALAQGTRFPQQPASQLIRLSRALRYSLRSMSLPDISQAERMRLQREFQILESDISLTRIIIHSSTINTTESR